MKRKQQIVNVTTQVVKGDSVPNSKLGKRKTEKHLIIRVAMSIVAFIEKLVLKLGNAFTSSLSNVMSDNIDRNFKSVEHFSTFLSEVIESADLSNNPPANSYLHKM